MRTDGCLLLFLGGVAGGFVTGLAGFGTALVVLGIWLYVLPPSTVVPLVLICSIVAQTSTLHSFWRSFDFKLVWPFLLGGLAGVPLGTMLVAHADPRVFKLSVGVLLLVFPTALYFNRNPIALSFGGRVADAVIGFARRSRPARVGRAAGIRHRRFARWAPYHVLSDKNFRDVVLGLLFLSGVGLVWGSLGLR